MGLNWFEFNGVRSDTKGIVISAVPSFSTGQKKVNSYSIPGRNGVIVRDTGAFSNVTQAYDIWFKGGSTSGTRETAHAIALWLMSASGYCTLTDSYDTTVFRKALYEGPNNVTDFLAKYGRATISFGCRPEYWLNSGKTQQTITTGTVLTNNYMPAKPLIVLTGTGDGSITIGDSTIAIDGMTGGMTIDCESMDAYNGTTNCNNLITVTGGFPVLKNGNNTVTFSGDIDTFKITPRWWTV